MGSQSNLAWLLAACPVVIIRKCLAAVPEFCIGGAPASVSPSVFRIDLDGPVIIRNRLPVVAKFAIGNTPVIIASAFLGLISMALS